MVGDFNSADPIGALQSNASYITKGARADDTARSATVSAAFDQKQEPRSVMVAAADVALARIYIMRRRVVYTPRR